MSSLVWRRELAAFLFLSKLQSFTISFSYEVLFQYVQRILKDYIGTQVYLVSMTSWTINKFIGEILHLLCFIPDYFCFVVADKSSVAYTRDLRYQLMKFRGYKDYQISQWSMWTRSSYNGYVEVLEGSYNFS